MTDEANSEETNDETEDVALTALRAAVAETGYEVQNVEMLARELEAHGWIYLGRVQPSKD